MLSALGIMVAFAVSSISGAGPATLSATWSVTSTSAGHLTTVAIQAALTAACVAD